ncbi:MAG: rod shape-determining protein MreC [Bdellovibrionota bacterium]
MNFIKRHAFWIISVFTIALAVFFFSSTQSVNRDLSFIEKIVYITSKPIEMAFYYGKKWTVTSYESYIDLKNAKQESSALKKENMELKAKLNILATTSIENDRLRKLLDFKDRSQFKLLSCEIAQSDPSFLYKNIRINRGKNDGVQYGMGVLTTRGVVGVVIRVYGSVSDVLLLTDPNSNIDVIVARNRRRGVLQGGVSYAMQFKYFERGNNLLIGDEIVTSGLTGAFPSGIPVGKVVSINSGQDNVTQIVEVEPAVDFSDFKEALVLLTPNREVDIIQTEGGGDWIKKLIESNAGKNGG